MHALKFLFDHFKTKKVAFRLFDACVSSLAHNLLSILSSYTDIFFLFFSDSGPPVKQVVRSHMLHIPVIVSQYMSVMKMEVLVFSLLQHSD